MKISERQELIKYRLRKARLTYDEIESHIRNGLLNTAVNRLYYACYYAVTALLLDVEIQTQTHSGVRQMFGLHFIKTGKISKQSGKFFTDIYDLRQSSDYDDFIEFQRNDVLDLLKPARQLITEIETSLKDLFE